MATRASGTSSGGSSRSTVTTWRPSGSRWTDPTSMTSSPFWRPGRIGSAGPFAHTGPEPMSGDGQEA
eukprot:9811478-Alexandrium_andersonii.AAC.1